MKKLFIIFILLLIGLVSFGQAGTQKIRNNLRIMDDLTVDSTLTVTDSLILSRLASSNTLVLSPTATGNVDTLETSDISTITISSFKADTITVTNGMLVNGNVGIGTSSPGEKLEVAGRVKITGVDGGIVAPSFLVSPSSSHARIVVNSDADKEAGFDWFKAGSRKWLAYIPANSDDLRFNDGSDRITFQSGGNVGINETIPTYKLDVNGTGRFTGSLYIEDVLQVDGTITGYQSDGTTSLYFHEYNLPAISASAGGSGATLTAPTANTLGGYQLNAVGETVVFQTHVENDWDGATDLIFEVFWEVNEAASADGTVDLKVIFYYKGDHEVSNKTQTVEVAHTITGDKAQYTQHETAFTIDWDLGGNVVQAGDQFGIILNLETDTSECDDIIVNYIEFKYQTTKPAPETN